MREEGKSEERIEDRWQDVKIERDRELEIDREKGEERRGGRRER